MCSQKRASQAGSTRLFTRSELQARLPPLSTYLSPTLISFFFPLRSCPHSLGPCLSTDALEVSCHAHWRRSSIDHPQRLRQPPCSPPMFRRIRKINFCPSAEDTKKHFLVRETVVDCRELTPPWIPLKMIRGFVFSDPSHCAQTLFMIPAMQSRIGIFEETKH